MTVVIVIDIGRLVLAESPPASPVFNNPVEESFFKADVMTHFFAFDPFMAQNFCPLGQKFLIEG